MTNPQVDNRRNEIILNGTRYPITGELVLQPTSTFAQKQVIGSYGVDSMQRFDTWQVPLYPAYCGIEEAIINVERASGRSWWTNLQTENDGYATLPRLAKEITEFNDYAPTGQITSTTCAGAANWVLTAGNVLPANYVSLTTTSPYLYIQVSPHWATTVHVQWSTVGGSVSSSTIDVLGTTGWTNIYTGTTDASFHNDINITDQYIQAVRFRITGSSTSVAFTDFKMTRGSIPAVTGTLGTACNFNSNLYWARGRYLLKMDTDRGGFTAIWYAPANITAMVPSFDNKMYIFCGASAMTWMDTSENFYGDYIGAATATGTTINYAEYLVQKAASGTLPRLGGTWALQIDNKLFYLTSDGLTYYNTTPYTFGAAWTAGGQLSDIPGQVANLLQGYDADGNTVMYAATQSWLKVYDDTNAIWTSTEVKLPDHPNGGKGATYWNGSHFISYGLGVKLYAPIDYKVDDVGLNRDDGIPPEYDGEIVKLCGDTAHPWMIAAVDGTYGKSAGKSTLWSDDGAGWRNIWSVADRVSQKLNSGYGFTYGASWSSQTFTPTTTHTISSVALQLSRVGSPGTVTVSIRATDVSGHPTGSDLTSGTIDGNSLPVSSLFGSWKSFNQWTNIRFSSSILLTASTKYAIVVNASAGDINNGVYWFVMTSVGSDTYTGGNAESSVDSGANWTSNDTPPTLYKDYTFVEQSNEMHEVILSPAESEYAVYWDCGGTIYYMNIPRGSQSPRQIVQEFAATGAHVSPAFAAGFPVGDKIAARVRCYVRGDVSADETVTVKYRTDYSTNDLDTTWTTLGSAITSSGETTLLMPNSSTPTGTSFKSIQLRLDLARAAASTTETPVVVYLALDYYKVLPKSWGWSATLDLTNKYRDNSSDQLITALKTAAETKTMVTLVWEDTTKYVRIEDVQISHTTGDRPRGSAKIFMTEA